MKRDTAEGIQTEVLKGNLNLYLRHQATVDLKGWKIPETTLVYPWIQRLFPETKFIFWVRIRRDCIMGAHLTDNLHDWGIDYPPTEDMHREERAYLLDVPLPVGEGLARKAGFLD